MIMCPLQVRWLIFIDQANKSKSITMRCNLTKKKQTFYNLNDLHKIRTKHDTLLAQSSS
jgi:hypothetical protein